MSLYPTRTAVGALAAWCAASLVAVFWPVWLPALVLGAAALALLALADGRAAASEPAVCIERRLPAFALQGRPTTLGLRIADPGGAGRARVVRGADGWPPELSADGPRFGPLVLAAGASLQIEETARPRRRGDIALGAPVVLVRSPLGLW